MAAIKCFDDAAAAGPVRELRIISFENDLDSLRLAVDHPADFPYLRHEAPAAILTNGRWESRAWPGLSWTLVLGDFPGTIPDAPFPPDVIFYDMFSTKTSTQLWSFRTFHSLFQACADRAAELFTYTCSTANRAAMLAAGFHVARGRNAGAKIETTIALTAAAAHDSRRPAREILSSDWLAKWSRSAAKFPADIALAERPHFEKLIRDHEQFRKFAATERLPSTTQNSE
jgi:queuine tRNA-ribosyltransferase